MYAHEIEAIEKNFNRLHPLAEENIKAIADALAVKGKIEVKIDIPLENVDELDSLINEAYGDV